MKKLLVILFAISAILVKAQTPQGINYQSIIRNTAGVVLPSTAVTVEFKLYASPSPTAILLYDETHSATTNSFGMVNLVIGQGTPVGGAVAFNNIPWITGVHYEVYVNSLIVGSRQAFMSVPYALHAPAPAITFSNNTLSVGGNTVNISTGPTYTAGTGIGISGNTITNNAPDQTVTVNGLGSATVTGTYPNFTIETPTVAATTPPNIIGAGSATVTSSGNTFTVNTPAYVPPTITGAGSATVTSAGNTFTVDAPVYTAGNGIDITGGVISNTAVAATPTITGAGSATVTSAGNTFTVNTPVPQLYTAGSDIFISGGGVIDNTAPDKTVTITAAGAATVTGSYPNFTLNVPNGTALPNGYTGQLLFNNGTTWDTIPRMNLYFDGTNFGIGTLAPQMNFHVVGAGRFDASVTTPQVFTDNIKITGGTNGQVLTSDNAGNGTWQTPPTYSLTQGGSNINLTQNGSTIATVTLTAATSTSLSAGSSNIVLNQSGNAYTITPVTPNFTNVGPSTITGTYPNYTLTSTASPSTTLVQGSNVTLNQSGTTYTVSSVTPTLTVNGGALTGSYPTQTLTIPTSSTTVLTSSTNVVISGTAPNYTISSPSQSLSVNSNSLSITGGNTVTIPTSTVVAGNTNITVTPSGNTYSVSAVTPTLTVNGGALTGAYPNQTLTIPTSSTTVLTSSTNVVISGTAPNYTISSPSQSLSVNSNSLSITGGNTVTIPTSTVVAGNTNITVTPSGNTYSVSAVTPTLTVNGGGGSLAGAYPNQTLTIPSSSTTILTASTNVVISGTAPNYTIAAVDPPLSLTGTTLTSGVTTNSVSLAGFNGIYGGSGSIQTGSTTVTVGTNTLTFLSGNTANKSIANFFGGGITGTHLAIGHVNANPASIKLLGSVSSSPVDYGYVSGSSSGIAISGGTSSNGLFVTNAAEVGAGAFATGIGKFMITHAATTAAPTMHLRETSANSLTRIKFSNTNVANSFFEIATQVTSTFNTSALSINVNDASNVYNPVFLISGGRQVYVNALNLPLASFHVMEGASTSGGGIISEGFGQAGQIMITRNNQTATTRVAVVSGNELGRLVFAGFNSTSFNNNSSRIVVNATENFTGSGQGAEMVFSTVPNGSSATQDVMRLTNDGRVEVKNGLLIPYSGPSLGKVLTSDATGNATWQLPPAGPWSRNSGTVTLTTGTDFVGIGTNTPNAPLQVANYISFENNGSNTSLGYNAGGGTSPNNYYNTFVGASAGQQAATGTGNSNSFLGYHAGLNTTNGFNNTFMGTNAGVANNVGSSNSFFGTAAGQANSTGINNVFVGTGAGSNNTTAQNNTFLGMNADLSSSTQYTNATAIGFNTKVNDDNTIALGNNSDVVIGGTKAAVVTPTAGGRYLSIVNNGPYSNTSITAIELQGNVNGGSATVGKIEFINGLSPTGIARIEAFTSSASVSQGALRFYTNAGSLTEAMRITPTGSVGIGTTTPGGLFELALDQGRKPGTTVWTVTSDERLKTIEGAYTKGLNAILQLNPVKYHYKNVGERKFRDEVLNKEQIGFSAQEVQRIFPEAVEVDADGYLSLNIHAVLIAYTNAVKELNAKAEAQQKTIEEQKKAMEELQQKYDERLKKLEAALETKTQK
jgi:hypothetical protein